MKFKSWEEMTPEERVDAVAETARAAWARVSECQNALAAAEGDAAVYREALRLARRQLANGDEVTGENP